MIGSLVALPLPGTFPDPPKSHLFVDPLQQKLWLDESIEVPIFIGSTRTSRNLRISSQLYNDETEYVRLGDALLAYL
jgi:hypothetical protein